MFTDVFTRDEEHTFLLGDEETVFTPAQRAYMVASIINTITIKVAQGRKSGVLGLLGAIESGQADDSDILENGGAGAENKKKSFRTISFSYLKEHGAYGGGFPLHDADANEDCFDYSEIPIDQWPMRKYLYECWARPANWMKMQPLGQIRDYFGEKTGMYFAWLGFYTKMLIIPSIFGVLTVIGGLISASHNVVHTPFCQSAPTIAEEEVIKHNYTLGENGTTITTDINSTVLMSKHYMFCRDCATTLCDFKPAEEMCSAAWLNDTFEWYGSSLFSAFMAVWAVLFVEGWEKRQNELASLWDVGEREFSAQQTRSEYMIKVKTIKFNPVTQMVEPNLSKSSFFNRLFASLATVLFFVSIVLSLLSMVIIYKKVGPGLVSDWLRRETTEKTAIAEYVVSPILFVSVSSSLLNGVCIAIMTKVYMKIAKFLTDLEMHRTDFQYEHSYTYKVVVFQFINFYGALFFLVFFKPTLPAEPLSKDVTIACSETGCTMDITVQLLIVMIGKQTVNNLMEVGMPVIKRTIRRCFWKISGDRRGAADFNDSEMVPRWQKDNMLEQPGNIYLFGDYLEMLIQFGFITMFAASMPLAPLFALVNNILEIRIDAYKQICEMQRLVLFLIQVIKSFWVRGIPMRSPSIEPWFSLLRIFTRIACFTNAWTIAFTMSMIDRFVYQQFNGIFFDADSYFNFTVTPVETVRWCTDLSENASYLEEVHCNEGVRLDHTGVRQSVSFFPCPYQTRLVETCFIRDYRDPEHDFRPSTSYFVVWAFRLAFIVLFEHIISLLQTVMQASIPDKGENVVIHEQREAYLQRQRFRKAEGTLQEDVDDETESLIDPSERLKPGEEEIFVNALPGKVLLKQVMMKDKKKSKKPFYVRVRQYLPFFC